jgi:hypothetical protein
MKRHSSEKDFSGNDYTGNRSNTGFDQGDREYGNITNERDESDEDFSEEIEDEDEIADDDLTDDGDIPSEFPGRETERDYKAPKADRDYGNEGL